MLTPCKPEVLAPARGGPHHIPGVLAPDTEDVSLVVGGLTSRLISLILAACLRPSPLYIILIIIYLFVPLIDMTFHQKIVNSPLI